MFSFEGIGLVCYLIFLASGYLKEGCLVYRSSQSQMPCVNRANSLLS